MRIINLLVLLVILNGCSQPSDLRAPCPNYGRHCAQTAINVDPLF